MASEYFSFEGSFNFVKIYEPEVKFNKAQWALTFYPKDEVELGKMIATGIEIEPRKDKFSGKMGFILRRPCERDFGGETFTFNPPAVFGQVTSKFIDTTTGKLVGSYPKGKAPKTMSYVGAAHPIPRDSKGSVNITIYETSSGKKGHRLESIYVSELGEVYSKNETKVMEEVKKVEEPADDEVIILNEKAPW